jgi:hypothetical protein
MPTMKAGVVALRPSWTVAEEVLPCMHSPEKRHSSSVADFPHDSQNHQLLPSQHHHDERKESSDFGQHLEACKRNYYSKKGMGTKEQRQPKSLLAMDLNRGRWHRSHRQPMSISLPGSQKLEGEKKEDGLRWIWIQ